MFRRRDIRIKAMQYLYADYVRKGITTSTSSADEASLGKIFRKEVNQVKRGVLSILQLLLGWVEVGSKRDKGARYGLDALMDNKILRRLACDARYEHLCGVHGKLWEKETLILLYYNQVKEVENLSVASLAREEEKKDGRFIDRLLKKVVFQRGDIAEELSNVDMSWEANSPLIKELSFSFFKKFAESPEIAFEPLIQSVFPQERDFYTGIIKWVLGERVRYTEWIKAQSKHWDIERLVLLDYILLMMALAEVCHFPWTAKSIVVNEYLEIAKKYSTPRSSLFLHGILDSVLEAQGFKK